MIIKNWMKKDPVTIESDMLASEALKIFEENKVSFIPVLDQGKLRGILPRRDLRAAASYVMAKSDVHEMDFFNTRLQVKDLMVRKPITVSADDTVDAALKKGEQFGRSFFPVLDGDRVVGIISYMDIYNSLYQILGVGEATDELSLDVEGMERYSLSDIVQTVEDSGGKIHSIFSLKHPDSGKKRLFLRLITENVNNIQKAMQDKGYKLLET